MRVTIQMYSVNSVSQTFCAEMQRGGEESELGSKYQLSTTAITSICDCYHREAILCGGHCILCECSYRVMTYLLTASFVPYLSRLVFQ